MDNLKAEDIPFSSDWLKKHSPPIIFGTAGEIPTPEEKRIWKGLWDINDIPRTQDDENNLSFRVDIAKKHSFIPIIWDTRNNIELNNQFFNPSTMNNTPLTEGEKRVRKSFNPSGLKRVEEFKGIMADAIDHLNKVANQVVDSPSELGDDTGDFMREVATAKTQLQIASMCGVGALTHDITFKRLSSDTVINADMPQTGLPPHQQRVLDEKAELYTKATALNAFINTNPIFNNLPIEEQDALKKQVVIMGEYLEVLTNRIARFS